MAKGVPGRRGGLTGADYERLAAFRHALRQFLYFSETVAAQVGLTGQQYQVLLTLRSRVGKAPVTINDLARELLIRHNSAVGLVDRLAARALMGRHRSLQDRRKVQLRLTPKGERVLGRLASIHRAKLHRIGPGIYRVLGKLTGVWRRGGR